MCRCHKKWQDDHYDRSNFYPLTKTRRTLEAPLKPRTKHEKVERCNESTQKATLEKSPVASEKVVLRAPQKVRTTLTSPTNRDDPSQKDGTYMPSKTRPRRSSGAESFVNHHKKYLTKVRAGDQNPLNHAYML